MTRTIAAAVLCTFVATTVHAETLLNTGLRYAAQVTPVAAAGSCEESEARGRADAGEHGTKGWWIGGVVAGFGGGYIGTGIGTIVAAVHGPKPPAVPDGLDSACYRDGYRGRAKVKNVVAAVVGGAAGTVAFLITVQATCGNRSVFANRNSICAYYGY